MRAANDGCPPARRELVRWAAGLGAVTAESLAAREGIALASARGRLAAAERDGMMRAWRLVHGEPTLHTVTRKGLRAADVTGVGPGRVSPAGSRHAVACCGAAASLALAFPDHGVLGEPAIRRAERELGITPALLEPRLVRRGIPVRHRPDLLLAEGHDRGLIAVEVELTVKAPERLEAICRAWARSRAVSGVIYLAAPEVLAPLSRAIASARAAERVVALPLNAFG
ncbi:MAG TPA: hypothetical protein VF927_02065 [Solirubrobacteraceae bacterium]